MSKQTSEEVVELLPTDMQYTLGCLAEQEDESLVGYTLDSLPFGTRSVLLACEAIEATGVSAEAGYSLRFTRFGREVAQTCYKKHEGYIRYRWNELETVKTRREAAKLPPELQETLALLAGADREVAELTLIMLPRKQKQPLVELSAIEVDETDGYVEVDLTEKGRQIIAACAFLQAPEKLKQKQLDLEKARREYWEERFKNPRLSRFVTRPGDLRRKK